MTPPPTSIDGTDITGATIDGQDVQEITIDGQTVFTAQPQSVVTLANETDSRSRTGKSGVVIETKSLWPSIGATIGNITSGVTTAYLHFHTNNNTIGSLIATTSLSGLSSGDSFAFQNVNIGANDEYAILVDAGGSSYSMGFGNQAFPQTSADVDVIGGEDPASSTTDTKSARGIIQVGNVGI